MKNGKIILVAGSMFSGKTSYLIKAAEEYTKHNKSIKIFYPKLDIRYKEDSITSHDNSSIKATAIANPVDISADTEDLIIIDELQFFSESIVERLLDLRDLGKVVIAAGLDRDYRGKFFKNTKKIESIADEVKHLFAVCAVCKKTAAYSQRIRNGHAITGDEAIIAIGGKETYEPRCEKHFIKA